MPTLTRSLLVLLSGLSALGALATNIILPSWTQMGSTLQVSPERLSLLLSSFFAVFAIGQLIVGPLADRIGRRPVILGGLALFTLGSVLGALAPDLETLITARMVQAMGACATSVLARAVARDLFEGPALVRTLSLVMVAMAAAPGFSPLVGSALAAGFGWRGVFAVLAMASVALAFLYMASVGETLRAPQRQGLAAIAGAYLTLLRDLRFLRPALAVSLIIGALYTIFAASPALLSGNLGYGPTGLGLFFAGTVFVVFGASGAAPRLAARFGAKPVAVAGIGFAALGGAMLLAFALAPDILRYTLGVVIFLVGMGLVNPLATARALQPFGQQAGLAAALLGFLQMAAAAVGSWLVAALSVGPGMGMALIVLTASLAAVAVFLPGPKTAPA